MLHLRRRLESYLDWGFIRHVSRVCARQCNSHAALRLRRFHYLMTLYKRLYNQSTLVDLARYFGQTFRRRATMGRYFLLSSTLFSFNSQGISENDMNCAASLARDLEDEPPSEGRTKPSTTQLSEDGWQLCVTGVNFELWKRPLSGHPYLSEYKCIGTFIDIPASAFFFAQIDLDYRKRWDANVIALNVVDRDGKTGSEVVHWVTHFPYPMYSREYVYVRRACIDNDNKLMVITARHVDHPSCPSNQSVVRVEPYSSQMVIKPHNTFNDLGFDYVLTYFDDPKSNMPSYTYKYMVNYGIPGFLCKVHDAAKAICDGRANKETVQQMSLISRLQSQYSSSQSQYNTLAG